MPSTGVFSATYRFFCISVVNTLVLICTTYPFFPYICSKRISFNMYNIPVLFRFSVVNILILYEQTRCIPLYSGSKLWL